jgi:hypothetical protein
LKVRAENRGVAILIVIGFVFLLGLAFFWLHVHSLSHRRTMVGLLEEHQAFSFAESAAKVFMVYLEDVFRRREGCEKIYPADPAASNLALHLGRSPSSIGEVLHSDLAKFAEFEETVDAILQDLPSLRGKMRSFSPLTVSARFIETRSSGGALIGRIRINVVLWLKRERTTDGFYDYRFEFFKDFKLRNIIDPVVSKFTLFVRNVPDQDHYNINNKGFQQEEGDRRALVLFNDRKNNTALAPNDGIDRWKEAGWVYLGASPVLINIDGTHPCRRGSEAFMFFGDAFYGATTPLGSLSSRDYLPGSRLLARFTPIGTMNGWVSGEVLKEHVGGDEISKNNRKVKCFEIVWKQVQNNPDTDFWRCQGKMGALLLTDS